MDGHARRAVVAVSLIVLAAMTVPGTTEARSGRSHACIFDHSSLRTAPNTCRPRASSYPRYVRTSVERSIYDGSLTFGIPYRVLLAIAECESSLNPHADNGTHFGLYQFAPPTFRNGASQLSRDTGIQVHTYWNALDSSYVAGYLFATGQSGSWACEGPHAPTAGPAARGAVTG
ncbi:MAG TPA: transglycosylase SLT domain-containing protein [Chloroflexota bacterium]|nr:transglycosylase SLT domain-containing protein [Chloroflexota bacterium]